MSLYSASWSLAFAVNPVAFLPLHDVLGERRYWPLMILITAPAAALLLRLDRTADRPGRLRGVTPAPAEEEAAALPA